MRGTIYDFLRRSTSPSVRRWIKNQPWFLPLARVIFADTVYSHSYFHDIERIEAGSVSHIADWISAYLSPQSVLDVGCGPGHLMKALHDRGVDVYGVDIATAALQRVQEKGLNAQYFDLRNHDADLPGTPYDLVVSCEVAEHLPEEHAADFVCKLTEASRQVYLTAAEPNEKTGPGLYHFNEQPQSYWIDLFEEQGFQLNLEATESVRQHLSGKVVSYLSRPMIYTKSDQINLGNGPEFRD